MSADKKDFHFPVNPPDISITSDSIIKTVEIQNIGEIDFITGMRRPVISFSSFLPFYHDSYCQYTNIPNPDQAIKKLIALKDNKKPIRLLISESPINEMVIISKVDYQIKGGEVGDIYFDIDFRIHKEIKVRKIKASGSAQKTPVRPTPPKKKIYVVKKGDCLWDISKAQLGKASIWRTIYNIPENRKVIGSNPNLIYPGQKLVLP